MADNGEIPLTGDPRVDAALQRIKGKFRDLEDAMLVQVHLEKRMSERIKEHAQFIADHERWIQKRHEADEKFDLKMAEIEDKINFIVDRDMRREGGPEIAR